MVRMPWTAITTNIKGNGRSGSNKFVGQYIRKPTGSFHWSHDGKGRFTQLYRYEKTVRKKRQVGYIVD